MNEMERVKNCRTRLLLDSPFFGTLALRMELIEDPQAETMVTNGKVIKVNPAWSGGLTEAEIQGVLAHEVLHVANGHCWRRGDRDSEAWNVATDKAINGLLVSAGFTLPKDALPGMEGSAEELYQRQGEQGQKDRQGNKQGEKGQKDPGGCGAVEDAPDDDKSLQQDWKVAVKAAAEVARRQGELPAGLDRQIKEFIEPSVPWFVLLRDFVERTARNDYSWQVPNRRHLGRGIILPGLVSEELPAVVIAIDTSASISADVLSQFCEETSAVLGAYDTTLHVICCDAKVQSYQEMTRADLPLNIKPKGGGGTSFVPVFEFVEQNGITSACLIYLTDLEGRFPQAPEYPVLWVCYGTRTTVPFGTVIKL